MLPASVEPTFQQVDRQRARQSQHRIRTMSEGNTAELVKLHLGGFLKKEQPS